MEKYESKHVRIRRPAETVYNVLSRFDHLTPILSQHVEEWEADENSCSFKAKGFPVKLRIVEKEPFKLVKVTGEDGSPMDFTFWLQLVGVAPDDTRMRLVLHVDLNMMMRMMIGSKIQGAIDQVAEAVAKSFNAAPQV